MLVQLHEFLPIALKVFNGTGVNGTVDRRCHLGAALGSCSFTEQCTEEKMHGLLAEICSSCISLVKLQGTPSCCLLCFCTWAL